MTPQFQRHMDSERVRPGEQNIPSTDMKQITTAYETSRFVLYIIYYSGGQVEENEMDRVCRMSG